MTNTYNWVIPTLSEEEGRNCVLRIRYNISSGDYNGWQHIDQMNAEMIDYRYPSSHFRLVFSIPISTVVNLCLIVIFCFCFLTLSDSMMFNHQFVKIPMFSMVTSTTLWRWTLLNLVVHSRFISLHRFHSFHFTQNHTITTQSHIYTYHTHTHNNAHTQITHITLSHNHNSLFHFLDWKELLLSYDIFSFSFSSS